MMQLTRTTFVATLAVAVLAGVALGAFAGGRPESAPVVAAPEAPILPVQMPISGTNTFAKVADAIKPAVINVNTVSKGTGGPLGGGVSRTVSSADEARMFVSFFSRQMLTSMSPAREFSPTIIPQYTSVPGPTIIVARSCRLIMA